VRLGILPGTFNPPTVAHLALACAALDYVDEVLFVLPRVLPHKQFEDAGFEQRLAMLRAATADEPRFGTLASSGGLFIEIARECRRPGTQLFFLCGRDAAERIVNWDYGEPGAFARMLDEFELLVAARQGEYCPPPEFRERIHALPMTACNEVSATEVRRRIAAGEPWEHLVPAAAVPLARAAYAR
jgi:nicotinate-nucleotide adenylyltransferase